MTSAKMTRPPRRSPLPWHRSGETSTSTCGVGPISTRRPSSRCWKRLRWLGRAELWIRDVNGLKKDARRQLDRYLEHPASDLLLLLIAASGEKLDRGLADHAVAVEFPVLGGDRLPKWIAHRAGELGVPITPEATTLLQEAIGTDLGALASELDKLTSYARGRTRVGMRDAGENAAPTIDEAAVAAVVGVRRGETMGDLLDRVAERDATGALALVEPVLAQPKVSAVGICHGPRDADAGSRVGPDAAWPRDERESAGAGILLFAQGDRGQSDASME